MNRKQTMDAYRLDLAEAEMVLGHINDLIARQERYRRGAQERPPDVSELRYDDLQLDRMKWEKIVKDIREFCPWIIKAYGWGMWYVLKAAYPRLNWDTQRIETGRHTVYHLIDNKVVEVQLVGYANYEQRIYCAFAEPMNTMFVYNKGNL